MSNFKDDAKELLSSIGGKENIVAVTHCMTRMRFVLKDNEKADKERIESLKCVKGTFLQAGQFQIIIGNKVSEFYNDFVKLADIESSSKEEIKEVAKSNMSFLQKLMSNLAEIFAPLIPAIIVGGLILGVRNIIGDIKFFDNGTKSLTEISQFWSGLNSFLWLIGQAIFHFLPVGITWAITRKMGTTQILGIVLGITLVSPQLMNAYAVSTATNIPVWDFGFMKIKMIGYQAQVIPAIFAGFLLVYLERFFRKITPPSISMIVVPLLSLIPTVIVAHTILGPIGWAIGAFISNIVYSGLTSKLNWLFAGVFGFVYAPLVITGLHHMTNAIDLQLMAQFNGTMLWPMIALSNIAQGSSVLAMIYLYRKDKEQQQLFVPACISAYLGVTEPALFGVNLKYGYPFICGMIGSGVAGIVSVKGGVIANAIGIGGIPGVLSIKPNSIPLFLVAMLIAIILPVTLVFIAHKRKRGGF